MFFRGSYVMIFYFGFDNVFNFYFELKILLNIMLDWNEKKINEEIISCEIIRMVEWLNWFVKYKLKKKYEFKLFKIFKVWLI